MRESKGCVLSGCGCALALMIGCPVVIGLEDETYRRLTLGFLLIFLLGALVMAGSGRRPDPGLWKCESCGEPNSESQAGCEACGKHRT